MTVRLGIDVLRAQAFAPLAGKRVGLFTHLAACAGDLVTTYQHLTQAEPVNVVALFAPEHGFAGAAPDGAHIDSSTDARTGLPIHSLYGKTRRPTADMLKDIDVVVVDIQDVGVRYYTFVWTMTYLLEACGEYGVAVIVLDRPNPLGDAIYGLPLYPEMESLVGRYNVPNAHGMTIGEMACMVNGSWSKHPADLTVIPCEGWQRAMRWHETGLHWIPPSPAMPHLSTVSHYPGACLIEGTTLSEGRGTALPFEIVGAPYIDGIWLADHLNKLGFSGVCFRPHLFRPTASKYAGQDCSGVQAHITDLAAYHPLHTWLGVLREIRHHYPADFGWTAPHAGVVSWGEVCHFDLLTGSNNMREGIDDGARLAFLFRDEATYCQSFMERRRPYLIY
jgi:uncharacterized protein YbbC (DUF1343 family)